MNKTSIEWTDRSANPVGARHKITGKVGWHCVMKSAGCAHCYSQRRNKWVGTGLDFTNRSAEFVDLFFDHRPLEAILRVKEPQKIFLCDMTDLFMDGIPDDWILKIWCVMEEAKQHTFQILTKRPERMAEWVSQYKTGLAWARWPLPNVWLGVSVEDQKNADERIPHLLKTPAAVRFLSCEPLLGPIDLENVRHTLIGESFKIASVLRGDDGFGLNAPRNRIAWVIVGGESGPGARPMHPVWARSIRDQCVKAGVAYHFKQWGEWAPVTDHTPRGVKLVYVDRRGGVTPACSPYEPGCPCDHSPHDEPMVRVGKKRAGRRLDGRTWDQFPETTSTEVIHHGHT